MIFYNNWFINLSESTIYLLGDQELISLWEDTHKRNKKIWKMKMDKIKNKTKILDDIETKPKLERILKGVGSDHQNKLYKRKQKEAKKEEVIELRKTNEKLNKENSENNKFGVRKDNIPINIRFKKVKNKIKVTTDPDILKSNSTDSTQALKSVHNTLAHLRNREIDRSVPYKDRGIAANYERTHKVIHTTGMGKPDWYASKEENLKNRVDPDFKNRMINHEKEHDENDRYITAKYGKSVANRLYKMSEKASRDSIKGKGEAYKNDPLEHNAFRAGAGKKDIQHSHEVLDRAVKGKKTPSIDDSDKIRQIYGNAPVNPKKTD